MEATGVYWKPVWHVLEGHFELVLAQPAHVKNMPGWPCPGFVDTNRGATMRLEASMGKRRRRKFTGEFKKEAVRLFREGERSIGQVAKELDLTESALRNWVKQYKVDHGEGPREALTTAERDELGSLRRRVRTLEQEREIWCLRCLLLVMYTHPFSKEALTLHLARSEGHERYFGCNSMHRRVLASSHQHLVAEAPKITPSGQTIVKPTALGPGANTDTKLLIYGLFQKGRVLAQDAVSVSLPSFFSTL